MIFPFVRPEMYVFDNGLIALSIDRNHGFYSLTWDDAASVQKIAGEVRLTDGRTLSTADAVRHSLHSRRVKDRFGVGTEVTVLHHFATGPELKQTFWVYDGRPEAMLRLDLVGGKGSNMIAPLTTTSPVKIAHEDRLRSLFVPWDNDMYFRYRSDGWGEGEGDGDGSYEVGAVWDDTSRKGLVIGSVDHDLWKSAIRFWRKDGDVSAIRAVAGVTSKYTHDTQPHGVVTGRIVRSPRMVVGWYGDWREGLERYGDLNALVRPPLPWEGGKPFFWNSWSGHKTKVSAADARFATDFIHDRLPRFRSGGTAYVNFDAGAGNLTPDQMAAFIDHAHALGLRAGIYWTPFACWSALDKPAGIGKATFEQLVLKDDKGQPLPKLDGAYPLDPSHPLVLARIDNQLKKFVGQGFDYVKLDFLSHGAMEGRHKNPKVTTGTAAYNLGMKRIADDLSPKKIGRPFFISESIAPLFPQGYAHSRRISCDVFANIGASEYLMNSANYAWWEAGRIYRFSDPDSATVFQAEGESSTTAAEARTRFNASVVAGGMMILGDDLGKPEAQVRVLDLFTNEAALDIARRESPFRPIDGDTETRAGEAFERIDGDTAYVAVFNYDKTKTVTKRFSAERLGLRAGHWTVRDVWSPAEWLLTGELNLTVAPMSSQLVRLQRKP